MARRNRAADRAARRRAARLRRLLVAGAVVVVLLVAAGGGWWFLGGSGGGDGEQPQAGSARQRTLLVQVVGAEGAATTSELFGVDPGGSAAAGVLIPSRLFVDVAGSGSLPFGEALTLPDRTASADALTDLLGVSVTGSWVLDEQSLAALVDVVGGVQAEVDVDVVTTDADGNETVVVRAGAQELKGKAAAAYATYSAPDEPEQARLARFNDVMDGVLRGLPESETGVSSAMRVLADGSRSTLSASQLAGLLADLHAAADKDALVSDVLPVNEIDTGASLPSYGIDAGGATTMIRARFSGALQRDAAGDQVRVLVQNGLGTPGLVDKARARLVEDGFQFVNGGNAASFEPEPSAVLIPDGTAESQERGEKVASSLGLPKSAIGVSNRGQTVADVIVILGSDFRP